MPTSMTAAPSLTISAVISPGTPENRRQRGIHGYNNNDYYKRLKVKKQCPLLKDTSAAQMLADFWPKA